MAANDWKALSGLAYTTIAPPAVTTVPGFEATDAVTSWAARPPGTSTTTHRAVYSIGKPVRIGPGWNVFDVVLLPGDWTGDGRSDVLARKPKATSSTGATARVASPGPAP